MDDMEPTRHRRMTEDDLVQMQLRLFKHLVDSHDHTPDEAAEVVLRGTVEMLWPGEDVNR